MLNLCSQERDILKNIGKVADILHVPTYAVGGFVRDKLLMVHSKDIDIVCVGNAKVVAEQYKQCFAPRARLTVFGKFGVVRLSTADREIEFVAARKESYHANSRNPQVCAGSFKDDQLRRDFTINTLAVCLNEARFGEVIGCDGALADLENRIIRTPTDPHKTFCDDPLRILRAVRFAARLDFSIHPQTLEAMAAHVDRMAIVSQERITDELNKIMQSDFPAKGMFLLDEIGLLQTLLPELTDLKGVEYVDNKGHKDNFYHSLCVLDNISLQTQKLWLRWAALLHDIGKARTKKFSPVHGWTFRMHELVGSRMVAKIFRRLKMPRYSECVAYVEKLISLHHRPISLTGNDITDSAVRRLLTDAGEQWDDLLCLCNADITSKNRERVKRYRANFQEVKRRALAVEQADELRNFQPPLSGREIMDHFQLPPCKQVGIIKGMIKEAILEGQIPNTPEAAFDYMCCIGSSVLVAS